jgi:hypothetical protein
MIVIRNAFAAWAIELAGRCVDDDIGGIEEAARSYREAEAGHTAVAGLRRAEGNNTTFLMTQSACCPEFSSSGG